MPAGAVAQTTVLVSGTHARHIRNNASHCLGLKPHVLPPGDRRKHSSAAIPGRIPRMPTFFRLEWARKRRGWPSAALAPTQTRWRRSRSRVDRQLLHTAPSLAVDPAGTAFAPLGRSPAIRTIGVDCRAPEARCRSKPGRSVATPATQIRSTTAISARSISETADPVKDIWNPFKGCGIVKARYTRRVFDPPLPRNPIW
jgi:hypothetical protein